jgi:hypothetical protein
VGISTTVRPAIEAAPSQINMRILALIATLSFAPSTVVCGKLGATLLGIGVEI